MLVARVQFYEYGTSTSNVQVQEINIYSEILLNNMIMLRRQHCKTVTGILLVFFKGTDSNLTTDQIYLYLDCQSEQSVTR